MFHCYSTLLLAVVPPARRSRSSCKASLTQLLPVAKHQCVGVPFILALLLAVMSQSIISGTWQVISGARSEDWDSRMVPACSACYVQPLNAVSYDACL